MSVLENLKMLVVEDNPRVRYMIVNLLRSLGASHIHEASEGGEAVTVLTKTPVDLVLTDCNMAPMNGIAMAEWVRRAPESPDKYMPIMMISSLDEDVWMSRALDAGINTFLPKPIKVKHFAVALHELIQRRPMFVETDTYFGPDRRSPASPNYSGVERRKRDVAPKPEPNRTVLPQETGANAWRQ